jgi:hypothetical protein
VNSGVPRSIANAGCSLSHSVNWAGTLVCDLERAVSYFPNPLQSLQESDKVVLVLLREVEIETRVVEIDGVQQRGSRAIVKELIGDVYGGSRISPNGSYIAFLRAPVFLENKTGDPYILGASEIWLMGPHGESPHKIITADDLSGFKHIAWSPEGDRIAYKHWHQQGDDIVVSVESSDLNGTNKTTILSDNKLEDFAWVSSGRPIYSQNMEGYGSDYTADNLWR